MTRHRTLTAGLALGMGLLSFVPTGSFAGAATRTPVATTPHFAFHSDLAMNLNDALMAAGEARNAGEPGLFEAGASDPESACFEELPAAERAGWKRAVDYYAEIVSPEGSFSRERLLPRYELAGLGEAPESPEARCFVEITGGFRAAAAPAYAACRWERQDAENRRWIEELTGRLAEHEQGIAGRLETLYGTSWDALPIPVDVVETVSWSGASTVDEPDHILISTGYEGRSGLEAIFHEATHLLMGIGSPIRDALKEAADRLGVTLEGRRWRDTWHSVQFYITGEVVRRALRRTPARTPGGSDSGEPAYSPLIYSGDIYGRYHELLERVWAPYVGGGRTLSVAATEYVRALGRASDGEPREPPYPDP